MAFTNLSLLFLMLISIGASAEVGRDALDSGNGTCSRSDQATLMQSRVRVALAKGHDFRDGNIDYNKVYEYGPQKQSSGAPNQRQPATDDAKLDAAAAQDTRNLVDEIYKLGEKRGAAAAANPGLQDGKHFDVEMLIRRNGIFRGVTLLAGAPDAAQRRVVQFTAKAQSLSEDEKLKSMVLNADMSTTEGSISSTSSSGVAKTNQVISKFGTSAFSSKSFSAGLSASTPVVSVGLNFGSLDESTEGSTNDEKMNKELKQQASTFTKSTYYLEPRALLKIDPAYLEPTPDFVAAIKKLALKKGDPNFGKYTIRDLFKGYGTHTCTKVVLGGFWRMTADYKSTSKHSVMSMDKAASAALDKQTSFSLGASLGFEGASTANATGSANIGYSKQRNDKTQSNSGTSEKSNSATSDGTTHVRNEWKGGLSGGTAAQWRASLTSSKNSNWRIIDRNVDQCRGIWAWAQDAALKQAICSEWKAEFIKAMGMSGADAASAAAGCRSGSGNMQDFRVALTNKKQQKDAAAELKNQQACERKQGFVYKKGNCVAKQCVCGQAKGTVGAACPADGATKCLDSQKAQCRSYVCPYGFSKRAGSDSKLCATNQCDTPDRDTCCADIKKTSIFTLTVRTKDSRRCGTNSKVYGLVKGAAGRSTGWKILDIPGYNDFERGDMNDYTLRVPRNVEFTPTQVCLKTSGGGWCPDTVQPACRVYNGKMSKSAGSQIGIATNFNKFNKASVQCRPILNR